MGVGMSGQGEAQLVRSESLAGFSDLVSRLGGEPELLYRQVGLSRDVFDSPDNRLPYSAYVRLLELAAESLGCEDFGLRLAMNRKVLPIGILGLLMVHSPNVGAAIRAVCDHFRIVNQAVSFRLEEEGDYATLTRWDQMRERMPTFQSVSLSIANSLRALRLILGDDWTPTAVRFAHARPQVSRNFDRFFNLRVDFDQDVTGFIFPVGDLDKPIVNRDAEIEELLHQQVLNLERQQQTQHDFADKLRTLIQQSLHTEHCTQSNLAQILGMHPKKLQRRLREEGVNFRQLRAEVRIDVAEQLLRESALPLTNISEILGFTELSGFTRAFKDRHGVPPTVWRTGG